MKKLQYYVQSARLRTLPLSVAGIIMGAMIAASDSHWSTATFVWGLLTALSLQIISNVANELGDLQKGTDNENRLGPIRSVQSGKLTPQNLKGMLAVFVAIAMFSGLMLVVVSFHSLTSFYSLLMLFTGALAIVAAVKYTFGVKAYGYVGLGDVFVFIFFGLVSVLGMYFLLAGTFSPEVLLPASSIGFLSTAMLNQNNMRDIDNDKNFQKKTLAVRMGLNAAKTYHLVIIVLAFILMTSYCFFEKKGIFGYLYLISLPVFVHHLIYVLKNDGKSLDKHMKVIAAGTMLFAVSAGVGMILEQHMG